MTSSIAAARGSPSDDPASKVPCSSRRAAKMRRPLSELAVIAPSMMMPATGTIDAPVNGTAPEAKISESVGTTPEAMDTPTYRH